MGFPAFSSPIIESSQSGTSVASSPKDAAPAVSSSHRCRCPNIVAVPLAVCATASGVTAPSPVSPAATMARQVSPQPVTPITQSPYGKYPSARPLHQQGTPPASSDSVRPPVTAPPKRSGIQHKVPRLGVFKSSCNSPSGSPYCDPALPLPGCPPAPSPQSFFLLRLIETHGRGAFCRAQGRRLSAPRTLLVARRG